MLATGPAMAPGWVGRLVPTVLHFAILDAHALVADTQTGGAPIYGFGKFTVMEGVLVPEVIVQPVGTVHPYPVAPVTAGTENTTPVAPGHTFAGPVMVPGTAGVLLMVMHLGALVEEPPHANAAVTHNCPEVNAGGKVTVTFCVPCPLVIGVADPASVQL